MSGTPEVSVIVPCHNDGLFLTKALESVRVQTLKDLEVIIVENGSTDNTKSVAREFVHLDSRFRAVFHEQGLGAGTARNIGIDQARGRFLAFLDGDDLWHKEKLEKQTKLLKMSDCALSYTWYRKIDANGVLRGLIASSPRITYSDMIKTCEIGCSTVVYDVRKLGKRYFKNVRREDWILWMEILRDGHTACGIEAELSYYRISNGVQSILKRFRLTKAQWELYRIYGGFSRSRSVCLFAQHLYLGTKRLLR